MKDYEVREWVLENGYKFLDKEKMVVMYKALDKQIAKFPIETQKLMDIKWLCPICMKKIGDCISVDNYCSNCGQKILFGSQGD